ncbi:MAG: CRISPR-associated endoribonuclease Cas6 [Syntrophomonadaceae bacterium]|nr:CRISPR-associated endoribonuclease Cas6 [Syntrophomonadaceae bacterium]
MRISVVFNSDREIVLPVQYNHILQGFMYKNQLDRDYSQFLHQDIKGASNGKFNLFTFSRLMGKFKFSKETGKITLFPPAKLIISSAVDEFILDLADKLLKSELIFLGHNEVEIERIDMHEAVKFGKKVQIKMLSPLVGCTTSIREEKKYTNYYSPWQNQFTEIARNNLLSKYEVVHGYRPDNKEIKIIPNGSQEKKFEKILNYRGTVVKGYAGIYWLKGCPELIKVAYEAGLGFKNNQGFGCWEIVKQEAV